MLQNSFPDLNVKSDINPFIFTEVKTPIGKTPFRDRVKTYLLADTKPWANLYLPHPKGYKFEPCFLRTQFKELAYEFRSFKVRKDDIWILSFPKSGTTWTENIIWQLKNGFNFSKEPLALNTGFLLEPDLVTADIDAVQKTEFEKLNNAISPRVIKSHLPPHLLPVELWTVRPKIVYIARNPKDVAISLFHMLN
ncbi:sulfotransferase 1E1-like [Contarinia nasturtii]|uniref:sulfotransferase 1E1-like n=1 Tax=Contarinia nasturtii TaxID=265458 RepID=UPI0012D3A026|nr:sulfotransferase 1E1-like [Contarinia nasturtii]